MATKHTEGPWDGIELAGEGFDKPFVFKAGIFGAELSMARAPSRVVTQAELNANARLIAAAPDMLAALERIVAINGGTGGYKSMVDEFKHIAITALSKATA